MSLVHDAVASPTQFTDHLVVVALEHLLIDLQILIVAVIGAEV